jgi:hypothetical protein
MGAGCEAKGRLAVVLLCDCVLCRSACAVLAAAHVLVSWSSKHMADVSMRARPIQEGLQFALRLLQYRIIYVFYSDAV